MDNLANNVNEIAINFVRGDKVASVTAASATRLNSKIKKLAEEFPEDVQILAVNEDGSIFAHVPVKWVKISAPRKVSEEQRAAASERFKAFQKKKKDESTTDFGEFMNVPE